MGQRPQANLLNAFCRIRRSCVYRTAFYTIGDRQWTWFGTYTICFFLSNGRHIMSFYGLTVNRSQQVAILTEAVIGASWFTEIRLVNSECYNTETIENQKARHLAELLSFIHYHDVRLCPWFFPVFPSWNTLSTSISSHDFSWSTKAFANVMGRDSVSLRAGRSGNRIQVKVRFSAPV